MQGVSKKNNLPDLPKTVAIIPAAGEGVRMGSDRAKQFLDLGNRPLLAVTLEAFQECKSMDSIILVVPLMDVDHCQKKIVEAFELTKVDKVIPGGNRRQDSVRIGINATAGKYGLVLIHDGVRPIIDTQLIDKVIKAARRHRAVITGLPVKETVKKVNSHLEVMNTCNREQLWLVQTPQVFRYEDILYAHQKALKDGMENASDDSFLVERLGIPVKVIDGSEKNIKVTTPYDLELARFLLP